MKKFLVCMLSLAMALALAFGLAACDNGEEPGGGSGTFSEIAGDYSVDLSAAGMNLTVYLRIGSDGAFVFSSTTGFADSKSAGNVSQLTSGYLMLFTSVDGEAVETGTQSCNFTKESDNSLKFDGRIPYGSATFTSPMENDDGEMVTIYAVPLSQGGGEENTNTVTAGVYYATYTGSGMGGVTYDYYLTLRSDGRFTAGITFAMGGSTYMLYDYGTYSALGANCRMTSSVYNDPDDANNDLTESLTVDAAGVYTADVKIGPTAGDTVSVTATRLNAAPTETVLEYGGTYEQYDLELSVRADGRYTFTAAVGRDGTTEEGFIGLNTMGTAGILLPDGRSAPADITFDAAANELTASFPVGSSRTDVTLVPVEEVLPEPLTEILPGIYYVHYEKVSGMGGTVAYDYYLTLQEGNTYNAFVTFPMGSTTYSTYDYGTYTVTGGTECTLTSTSVYSDAAKQTLSLEGGVLSAQVYMVSMGTTPSFNSVTLEPVSAPAEVFMTYTASFPAGPSTFEFELKIYVDGYYTLNGESAMMGSIDEETGYIGLNLMVGNGIMFPDGEAERTVTVEDVDGVTHLKFPFSAEMIDTTLDFAPATASAE